MEKLSYGGIDVSKDRLDVVVLPEGWFFSVSNDTAGWAELVARLRPLAVSAIGLEPSGGYERGIIRALLAAGLSVRRINPNKLRQFARARGVLAKNDRLDARLIAEYVAIMPTRVVQRDDAVERLAEIVTMRRQLCDEHVAVENQAGPSRRCHAQAAQQTPPDPTGGRYPPPRQAPGRDGRHQCCFRSAL